MTTLFDVADMLKCARRVPRMETLTKGDMSLSTLVRLLEAAGYHLKLEKHGHVGAIDDILVEQRRG